MASQKRKNEGASKENSDPLLAGQKRSKGNTCMDTVSLARQEREKQGLWEAEISYGGEADLHKHETGCTKNPGHKQFVPVDKFSVSHLPAGCQDNDLVKFIRAQSDLTVRVVVKHVSESRPETVPGTDLSYPSYKDRGRRMMRTGTGLVCQVNKHTDKDGNDTCTCHECIISLSPKTDFAEIIVKSAAHVVYDDSEAAHTTCDLFFDKGGTVDQCSEAVSLRGVSVVRSVPHLDVCEIKCLSHDLHLIDKVNNMFNHWYRLSGTFCEKFNRLDPEQQKLPSLAAYLPKRMDKLTIIVSHPHGRSKHVSVGRCKKRAETEGTLAPYKYNTATCHGSSGASVVLLNRKSWYIFIDDLVHSINCNNLNHSGKVPY